MSSGDQYSCIQSWTTKKRRKTCTNTPFVAVLAVSRSRLSVATATRSSSEGLEGTPSFLPNGRTSSLPTSKNRVGIRFSVDWECRLLVYRWWQREVTIWGLGRRTTAAAPCSMRRLLRFGDHLIWSSLRALFLSVIFLACRLHFLLVAWRTVSAAVVLVDLMFVDLRVSSPSPACFDDEAGLDLKVECLSVWLRSQDLYRESGETFHIEEKKVAALRGWASSRA